VSHRPGAAYGRRLTRPLSVALVAALLVGPWSAVAEPSGSPEGSDGTGETERLAAEKALAEVQALRTEPVEERGPRRALLRQDLTLPLRDLQVGLPALAPDDRAVARSFLARPTDGAKDPYDGYLKPRQARNDCEVAPTPGSHVCVHWAHPGLERVNAPDPTDADSDGVPDYVETTRDELNHVWDRVVTQSGYRPPRADLGPDRGAGPDSRLDVYLTDLGDDYLYGYCVPETRGPRLTASGYCVLDNDYAPRQYGEAQAPLDNLRVTLAHEFFHAVQFAYDYQEDPWLMEGTAVWVEDEIYDDIDDNRQFIKGGPMTHPRVPLDGYGHGSAGFYAAWTWWRFLAETFPARGTGSLPLVIRDVWDRAAGSKPRANHSMRAMTGAVTARGGDVTNLVAAYGEAKRRPAQVFEEGAFYPRVPTLGTYRLAGGDRTPRKVATLPHLTSQTFMFVPDRGTRSHDWRLRFRINAPDLKRGSHVQVSVLRTSGRRVIREVRLNDRGNGRIITDFSSSLVRRVELTITNAGRRYECWRGTGLVCRGYPLDTGLRTEYRGTTFRSPPSGPDGETAQGS
jgi:hypothetical protein